MSGCNRRKGGEEDTPYQQIDTYDPDRPGNSSKHRADRRQSAGTILSRRGREEQKGEAFYVHEANVDSNIRGALADDDSSRFAQRSAIIPSSAEVM